MQNKTGMQLKLMHTSHTNVQAKIVSVILAAQNASKEIIRDLAVERRR